MKKTSFSRVVSTEKGEFGTPTFNCIHLPIFPTINEYYCLLEQSSYSKVYKSPADRHSFSLSMETIKKKIQNLPMYYSRQLVSLAFRLKLEALKAKFSKILNVPVEKNNSCYHNTLSSSTTESVLS